MSKWLFKSGGLSWGDNLIVFYNISAFRIWPDRGITFGGSGLIRGVAFCGSGPIRGVAFGGSGPIRGVAFGGSGLIKGGLLYYNMYMYK
jgi:hypothetical protein